jgi:hypothetical protein
LGKSIRGVNGKLVDGKREGKVLRNFLKLVRFANKHFLDNLSDKVISLFGKKKQTFL